MNVSANFTVLTGQDPEVLTDHGLRILRKLGVREGDTQWEPFQSKRMKGAVRSYIRGLRDNELEEFCPGAELGIAWRDVCRAVANEVMCEWMRYLVKR